MPSFASSITLVLRLRSSLFQFEGLKNKHRLNVILHIERPLHLVRDLSKITNGGQAEPVHTSLVSPRHTRRLGTKAAIALLATPPLPPALADTRDGAGLSRGAVLGVHARTRNERRKKEERTEKTKTAGKVRQVIKGGGSEVGALRGQGCTNRALSGIDI